MSTPGNSAATTDDFVIAGAGYTGRRLAPRLARRGHVAVIARTEASLHGLPGTIERSIGDLGTGDPVIREGATVIYLAPPPAVGNCDTTLEAFLRHSPPLARIVYVSTSGVYGDCGGALVGEDREAAPKTARAVRRLAAETAVRDWCAARDTDAVVLRVAGIYGPGRLPITRLARREPVLAEDDAGPGNRIHVDDLVETCLVAATAVRPPPIVNVCDGNPLSNTAFTKMVARISGMPPPPEIALEEARRTFTPMRWSFLAESRRLDNTRLRDGLGVRLRYGDPEAGIRASLAKD